MLRFTSLLLFLATATPAAAAPPPSLRGSPDSMVRQNQVARESDYTFLRDRAQLRGLTEKGLLVHLPGNGDYAVAAGVSNPYARPEVRTFVERLSAQYREACGERLVVTSLTRTRAGQPRNAHPLSVHPAGMAVDLRISQKRACRSWLEGTLLSLERQRLLDITRERRPPHYHVAIFPAAYASHVARMEAREVEPAAETEPAPAPASAAMEIQETANAIPTASSGFVAASSTERGSGSDRRGILGVLVIAAMAAAVLARRPVRGSR